MRRLGPTIVLLPLLVLACGDDGAEERPPSPTITEVQPPAPEDDATLLFDRDGNLLESDVVVAGLTLPRGLEPQMDTDRMHAYRSAVPLEKLQAYFGPRLVTGQVDRHGSGAIFRRATPREARGGIVQLDVALIPMNRTMTRIEIREIPPAPQNPPDEAEVLRTWNEQQRQLD